MSKKTFWLFCSLAILMVAATGCWQPAGEGESPTLVGLPLPSPTAEPTDTEEPATITPTPSPTADSELGAQVVEEVTEEGETPEVVAQEPTVDEIILGATLTVAASTQVFIDQTLTAEAEFDNIPTETPTLDFIVTATNTTPPNNQVPLGPDCIHEVRAGQNLYRLSLLYGVTIQEIMNASGIVNMNLILPGQKLRIPNCGTTGVVPPPTSTPKPNATLAPDPQPGIPGGNTGIGSGGVLCGIAPTDPNGGYWPACLGGYGGAVVTGTTGTTGDTQAVQPPSNTAGGVQHTVAAGETVFGIAQRYGVAPESIINANGLDSNGTILVGQILTIP